MLNRAKKALGPRKWVDCSQEDSTLTTLLAAMIYRASHADDGGSGSAKQLPGSLSIPDSAGLRALMS